MAVTSNCDWKYVGDLTYEPSEFHSLYIDISPNKLMTLMSEWRSVICPSLWQKINVGIRYSIPTLKTGDSLINR